MIINKLLSNLFFLFLFINLINCIIIKDSFIYEDLSYPAVYDKYPDNSQLNYCTFKFTYFASCTSDLYGPPTIAAISQDFNTISTFQVLSNSTSVIYSTVISIFNSTNQNNLTLAFNGCNYGGDANQIIYFQCHGLNLNELSITASQVYKSSYLGYVTLVTIEGLKYPLDLYSFGQLDIGVFYSLTMCGYSVDPSKTPIITDNCTLNLQFYKTQIAVSFSPAFKDSKLNILGKIQTFPNYNQSSTFVQNSYNAQSILTLNLKTDTPWSPYAELVIQEITFIYYCYPYYGESDGSINYILPMYPTPNRATNISLYYQQGDSATFCFNAAYNVQKYVPIEVKFTYGAQYIDPQNIIFLLLTGASGNSYTITPVQYILYNVSGIIVDLNFPFGFVRGQNGLLDWSYEPTFIVSNLYSGVSFGLQTINIKTTYMVDRSFVVDTTPPSVSDVQCINVGDGFYLFRISASDDSGLSIFKSYGGVDFNIASSLVSGTIYNGTFEILYSPIFDNGLLSFSIYDTFGNIFQINNNDIYTLNPIKQFKTGINTLYNTTSISISFDKYEMDVSNSSDYNTMYFDLGGQADISILLLFPSDKSFRKIEDGYIAKWDSVKKIYFVNFSIRRNIIRGPLEFLFYIYPYNNFLISDYIYQRFPKVIVKSSVDIQGPIISQINYLSGNVVDLDSNPNQLVGWEITIQDQINGISHGYILVNGLSDGTFHNFTINAENNEISKTVVISLTNISYFAQDYQITEVILYDTAGFISYFKTSSTYGQPYIGDYTINPLINYINDSSITKISVKISPLDDDTIPNLLSITPNVSTIDVGSNERGLSFDIVVSDDESGINIGQTPIVYLTSLFIETIECKSRIIDCSSSNQCTYRCEVEIPFGWGYPNSIYYQIYGIWNNNGMFSGFNTQSLKNMFGTNNITTTFTKNIPVILRTNKYSNLDTDLLIIGKSLKNSYNLLINYGKTSENIVPSCDNTYCRISTKKTNLPFTLQISTSDANQQSNIYTVVPVIVGNIDNSSGGGGSSSGSGSSSSLTPSCPGDPICGGPNNGYCSSKGCICFDPWVGDECQYKVIIVPQPSFNDTNPEIIINVPTENSKDNIQYSSLTSIVSLRELDISDSPVTTYNFSKWINHQVNSTLNEYYSNITNINDSGLTTQIKVSIQWFANQTNITFAGDILSMYPSTIKYTIEIKDYPFQSSLNRLELIMFASFTADDEVCTDQEFGDINSYDNSNYLKIKANDHSLYARFIKRGVIDSNKLVSITNRVLDGTSLTSTSGITETHSLIGIIIPNFKNNATVDPDFSILLDTSSFSNSLCNENDSGLSKTKIIGIAVGCAGFVIVVAVCVSYYFIRKRQDKVFSNKLKSLSK